MDVSETKITMENAVEQIPSQKEFQEAYLNIPSNHRVLEFESKDPKVCEAYIAAIADVLSNMWPDDENAKPAHIKEILLQEHVGPDGEVKGGYYSFPLGIHDALISSSDEELLHKIHEKAGDMYHEIIWWN